VQTNKIFSSNFKLPTTKNRGTIMLFQQMPC